MATNSTEIMNNANKSTRFVHPETSQSVIIDNVTKWLLVTGGPRLITLEI